MRKVLIIGPGGSGKSTFAAKLGALLNIQVTHLDQSYWKPGWVKPSAEEWLSTVEELINRDSWIIDGNYSGTLEVRVKACDTIVFLDIARTLCLWRIVRRLLFYRNRARPDMASGCREKLDLEFVLWVWNYSGRTKPKVVQLLRENSNDKRVVWLRSRAEVERFLESVETRKPDLRIGTLSQTIGT
jgi:adenylate kinase family enzyme